MMGDLLTDLLMSRARASGGTIMSMPITSDSAKPAFPRANENPWDGWQERHTGHTVLPPE
jgi:hypothetical protein